MHLIIIMEEQVLIAQCRLLSKKLLFVFVLCIQDIEFGKFVCYEYAYLKNANYIMDMYLYYSCYYLTY